MNVTELSQRIEHLVREMKEITLSAGVTETIYNRIMEVDQNLTIEDLQNRLNFLSFIHENEYKAVVEIWRLLPANVWQRYEDFGESQLREQKLLKSARQKLRKVWRERYGKESNAEQEINQGSTS